MKSFIFLLALCAPTTFAQSTNRISLQLGSATVWLGMDKTTAKNTIQASGMIFPDKDGSEGQVIVIATGIKSKRIYTLKFENNKLVFADRNWQYATDALPSVMGALTSLFEHGATACRISHAPMSSPDVKINRIFINCGARSVLLTYGSVNGMTDNTVSESIGHYR